MKFMVVIECNTLLIENTRYMLGLNLRNRAEAKH